MKYKIKVDVWVRLLLWVIILSFIPLFFVTSEEELWILAITTVLMVVIILPLFNAYYELTEEELIIHIYFFKQRIQYDKIKSIRKCENWYSSAAMSRERIEIKEHKKGLLRGTTYISPVDRDEFFSHLQHSCRNLENEIERTVWDE